MADQPKSEQPDHASLEMRIKALEDRLSKMQITEEEMKTYQKVASMLGAQAAPGTGPQAVSPAIAAGCINECVIRQPVIRYPIIRQPWPIIRQCTWECFECGGGFGPGGGTFGGGFGSLGG